MSLGRLHMHSEAACNVCRYNSMQSILGGAVMSLFLIALYAPWFTNASMLVAIVVSVLVNIFFMAGCMQMLPPHGVCIPPSQCCTDKEIVNLHRCRSFVACCVIRFVVIGLLASVIRFTVCKHNLHDRIFSMCKYTVVMWVCSKPISASSD